MHITSIATTPSNSLPPSDRGRFYPSTVDTVSLILVSLVILSSLAVAIHTCIPKLMQPSFRTKLNDKVTCDRCQYFNRAVDCRDYDSDSTRII
jgi:hypothetical protein